jgi:N-acetylglutamate synthase/N-acetylornithine aminotransferase
MGQAMVRAVTDLTADDVNRLRAACASHDCSTITDLLSTKDIVALLDAWEEREEAWTALGVSKEGREENDDPDVETLAQSIGIAMQYERDMREQAEGVAKELRARLTEAENKNEALRAALEDSDG